jgi:murein DD-endopeptidase MepM/ murein hydrolase activator NlpD
MRLLLRGFVLCLAVTAATISPTPEAGARRGRTPTTTATTPAHDQSPPVSAAVLRAQANQAAARYAEARTAAAKLDDQISALERQVADLETRIGPLRAEITRQAVAVYQDDVAVAAVTHFEAAAAMLRSDRAAHLVAELSARHVPAIGALQATKQGIRDRQSELRARRRDQDATMAALTEQRMQISRQLDELAAALPPKGSRRPLPRASRSAPPRLRQRLGGAALSVPSFVCPIDGPLAFGDDFGAPRGGGRRHMGNDLLSPSGSHNVAVVDGTIETRPWAGGGITIFLRGDDGNTYVYMHLQKIEGAVPRRVVQSELIGLTGNTGHAFGYHTHFEFHPGGGDAVSPYPLLAPACS